MDTVFRTHVKNARRFELLKRSIASARKENLDKMGQLYLVNDCSPMEWEEKLQELSKQEGLFYRRVPRSEGNTKQGLAFSFYESWGFTSPTLYCVDDIVFGKGAYAEFKRIDDEYIPYLEAHNINWGMIGSFACYGREQSFAEIPLWQYPTPYFYAMVCHVVNPLLAKIYWEEYVKWIEGKPTMIDPIHADDLWIKGMCMEKNFLIFNTLKDYGQHTGMSCRTFGNEKEDSSNYQSPFFVGE